MTHQRGAAWRRKGGVALPHRAWVREVERRGLLPSTLADVWLATRPS